MSASQDKGPRGDQNNAKSFSFSLFWICAFSRRENAQARRLQAPCVRAAPFLLLILCSKYISTGFFI